MKMGKKKYI